MPVKHIVLFGFKADASPDAVKKVGRMTELVSLHCFDRVVNHNSRGGNKVVADILELKDTCIHPTSQKPYIRSLSGGQDNSKEGLQVSSPIVVSSVYQGRTDRSYAIV